MKTVVGLYDELEDAREAVDEAGQLACRAVTSAWSRVT